MKSIMLNQNPTTFINFYILCSNFSSEQKEVIDKICVEHKNCKIEYIDMGNKFEDFNIPKISYILWTKAIFYRVLLQDLIPKENKILYLDGDTLIYKDLTKLYNYNISDKFYIGMLEKGFISSKLKNETIDNFINTGVLLCNLEELRKENISQKFIQYYRDNNNTIIFPVNEALNYVSHEKNGYFDPEYVVIAFCDEFDAFNYYSNSTLKINKTTVLKSYKDPYIYHLIIYEKPWKSIPKKNNKVCVDRFVRFYEMARKTDFYYKILEHFQVQ